MKTNLNPNLLKQNNYLRFEKAIADNFGLADFGKALGYPFKFRKSFVVGAAIFTLLLLAQSVSVFDSPMYFVGVACLLSAILFVFICSINTTENFSRGKTESDFLPNFKEIALWDDVLQPIFLGLAIYFVSFGLLSVLIAGAIRFASDAESKIEADKQKIISVVLPNAQTDTEIKAEAEKGSFSQTAATVMRLSLVFSVPIFLALLWAIFYFPVACAIAARTKSFTAILNPRVAFDTIKRLGSGYWKIVGVFLILGVAALCANIILQTIFSALNLPFLGNLPAKAVVSFLIFYLSLVFSVTLGTTLFKASSRLSLYRR